MSANRPIFRQESEQARASAWRGRVVLMRPVSFLFITGCAVAFSLALVLFFICGGYTRKARVAGVLAPTEGVAKIIAQQMGIVEAVHVREGERVAKDAALMILGDGRAGRAREDVGAAGSSRVADRQHALRRQAEFAMAAPNTAQGSCAKRRGGFERELEQVDAEMAAQAR